MNSHSDDKVAQWSMVFLRDHREFADFERFAASYSEAKCFDASSGSLLGKWFILGGGGMTGAVVLSHGLC